VASRRQSGRLTFAKAAWDKTDILEVRLANQEDRYIVLRERSVHVLGRGGVFCFFVHIQD